MLEIKNMNKSFNVGTVNEKQVISDLSITVNDGDFITIIGSNGAGKSTLLNLIAGTYMPDSGSMALDGEDITYHSEIKKARYIGRVFQDPMMGTAADMWIEENLALAYRRTKTRGIKWGMSNKEREIYRKQLSRLGLGLENSLNKKMGLLSGGQRQAVTLLMATLQKPKVLLLDEHTAALDPKTAAIVLELTKQIIEEDNLTALMVTHNMQNAIDIGNRLIMMHNGKIIMDISGEDKKKLTVEMLLRKFSEVSGEEFANDRALLS
ncbi:MAG: ABC transporter ATP-binding protein [Anaerofustis stercorihominis]|nr:ABC transporter ATP-binding protein [Anaerofustis stercorihominis]